MSLKSHLVYVVDDDREVRRSLSFMLGAGDARPHPFASGEDFLDALPDLKPGCILLDIRMPRKDGFEVMAELATRDVDWPVVAMTGHGEVSVAVRAMKLGAIDFIEKPFTESTLFASLRQGFARLDQRATSTGRRQEAMERIGQLTKREREVLDGLLAGLANKQIAERLGISLRTVEMHRGNMMGRMQVASLAEALTVAMEAGVEPKRTRQPSV